MAIPASWSVVLSAMTDMKAIENETSYPAQDGRPPDTDWIPDHALTETLRSSSGRFMGLGEGPAMDCDQMIGRFAQFLPENYPSVEVEQKAKELLQMVVEERGRERSTALGRDRGFER